MIGKVKFFDGPDDGSKDVLARIPAVERAGLGTLSENQAFSLEVEKGSNGRSIATGLKAS